MNPTTKSKFATELPKDYTGTLYFTNFSEEEFQAKWNNVVYTFSPKSTVPLFIPTASPIETFNIRRMFADQLGDREFRKSKKAGELSAKNAGANSLHSALSYTENDISSFVNRCLEPLSRSEVKTEEVEPEGKKRPRAKVAKPVKDASYGNDCGETDTLVTGKGESL